MAGQLQTFIHHMRATLASQASSSITDAQLLERFLGQRDEAAFELLVWRHGKMVFDTCCRILRNSHDAEDAFQACFLALAQCAGSIARGEALAGWLHKVASRLALRVKEQQARRQARECPLNDRLSSPEHMDPSAQAAQKEYRGLLDDEVNRLPDRFRIPFILCCLEGQSNAAVARELSCPLGTIESRLTRARRRLRAGLARRGVIPGTGLVTLIGREAGAASVPPTLIASTAKAATLTTVHNAAVAGLVSTRVASLTEGILRAMFMTKIKLASFILLAVTLAGTGTSALAYRRPALDTPGTTTSDKADNPKSANDGARIAALIDQLGNSSFAEREKASKELAQMGEAALAALRVAAQSGDAELRTRAAALVHAAETKATEAELLAPQRIHLAYKNSSLADAVADFRKQSGYNLVLDDPDGKLKNRKVTLDTGDATLWQALDLFCQQAGLSYNAAQKQPTMPAGGISGAVAPGGKSGGGGRMVAKKGNAPPPKLPPNFRAMLGTAEATKPLSLPSQIVLAEGQTPVPSDDRTAIRVAIAKRSAQAEKPAEGEILVPLEITPEFPLRWNKILAMNVTKAVDDQGQELEQVGDFTVASPKNLSHDEQVLKRLEDLRVVPATIHMKKGAKTHSIKELSGTFTASLVGKLRPVLTADNILHASGKIVTKAGDASLKVINVSRDLSGKVRIGFELMLPSDIGIDPKTGLRKPGFFVSSKAGIIELKQYDEASVRELALLDEEGNVLPPCALEIDTIPPGLSFVLHYLPREGDGKPAKLVYSVGKSASVSVPFTLHHVPIP